MAVMNRSVTAVAAEYQLVRRDDQLMVMTDV